MAEIIKKEIIKIRNGDLSRMCKKHKTSIPKVAEELNLNMDLLYKFNKGERTLRYTTWEKILKHL